MKMNPRYCCEVEPENMPDFVAVVRCKNCKYRNNPLACRMESEGMHTTDDWYCADGEQKGGSK